MRCRCSRSSAARTQASAAGRARMPPPATRRRARKGGPADLPAAAGAPARLPAGAARAPLAPLAPVPLARPRAGVLAGHARSNPPLRQPAAAVRQGVLVRRQPLAAAAGRPGVALDVSAVRLVLVVLVVLVVLAAPPARAGQSGR